MTKAKSPAGQRQGHTEKQYKDNPKSLLDKVLYLFLNGCHITEIEANRFAGTNDGRKLISTLRRLGYDIRDRRLKDRRKTYWLVSTQESKLPQLKFDGYAE